MVRSLIMVLSLCLTAPAFAQTDEDRAAAEAAIIQLDTDTRAGNIDGILSVMSPRIMAIMSATAGVEVADLRQSMADQTAQMMAMVVIDDFSLDMENALGSVTETGRAYFIVSTEMAMTVTNGDRTGRVRTTSDTLAFEDDGDWWLMRIENAYHQQLLVQAYPDLAGLEFAETSFEEIQ